MTSQNPSLYEMLTLNFGGELDLQRVSERDQVILSCSITCSAFLIAALAPWRIYPTMACPI